MSPIPMGTYLESNGLVTLEAENGQRIDGPTHAWLTSTAITGYTGTNYLHSLPDTDTFYPTTAITDSPKVEYLVNFTAPATYTVWVRGYADNADADTVNVGLANDRTAVTGFAPETWEWASGFEELVIETSGVRTLTVWMAEDGFRLDRLLLTTDTTFIPSGFGPTQSEQQTGSGGPIVLLDRTIVYTYDNLYRLTAADYSTGELYEYDYDPVGNRLQQIIDGDTTSYLYDAANRLDSVDGQSYNFDANGNLLTIGAMTNTWDAANRLVETRRAATTLEPIYNGVGDRVGQTLGGNTTYFALDVLGLPEVIQTSDGNTYLHLPGVIVAESAGGEVRYLLSDGLGSVRQGVDETGAVVSYHEFDPYGNPVAHPSNLPVSQPYGYTGEWWENEVGLLHLRARWYLPETGTFLSRDPVESEPPYQYVRGNPVNRMDASGMCELIDDFKCWEVYRQIILRCPECAEWETELPDGTRVKLHERDTEYLQRVLDNIKAYNVQGYHNSMPINPIALANSLPSVLSRANGYVEGRVAMFSAVGCVWTIVGEEIVYDFQSRQRQKFTYTQAPWNKRGYAPVPGLAFSVWSGSKAAYGGFLWGFTGQGIVKDYSGYFVGTSLGVNASIFKKLGFNAGPGIGWGQFTGAGNKPFGAITGGKGIVSGDVAYFSLNASTDAGLLTNSSLSRLPIDASMSGTWYTEVKKRRVNEYIGREIEMLEDVQNADDSPVGHIPLMLGNGFYDPDIRKMGVGIGANTFVKNGWITSTE